jgi:membrane protein implicated in regulation of membrane protease activity
MEIPMNVFLLGYLAALMPSVIAVAWLAWRSSRPADTNDPERHPVAIALRRKRGIDGARVTRREVLIKRGDTWWRYNAPKQVT